MIVEETVLIDGKPLKEGYDLLEAVIDESQRSGNNVTAFEISNAIRDHFVLIPKY